MPARKFRLPKAVSQHLSERLGTDARVSNVVEAEVPGLGAARAVTAYAEGDANRLVRVVVADDGALHDHADVVERLGHDPFVPTYPTAAAGPARERARVTIDPPVNRWRLSKCETERETITVTVPPTGATPKADVYLLADTTGSMGDILSTVAAAANAILTDPSLAGFDVAWGVGNYRDFPIDGIKNSYAFQHQVSPTTTVATATAAIATWNADEGSDTSEGQLYALDRLANDPTIGWRPDAKRIVVWMGDAPGHDPICPSVSGLASALDEAGVTASLVAADITVVAVGTATGAANDLDGDPNLFADDYADLGCVPAGLPGQATRISAATPGGSYTSGIMPADIVTNLVTLIQAAVSSTGNVSLVPTGDTAEFVESITPAGGFGPLPGDVEHVLTFEVVWRGTRDCADKPQELKGTIDVVADGVVVAQKRVEVVVPPCRLHYSVTMLCGEQRYDDRCTTVEPGHYSTLVSIYNPGTCTVVLEKRFAPLVVDGKAIGREPDTQPAKPFARIKLGPGEATMDDCCALEEAVGGVDGLIGVLDLVATGRLRVTVVRTTGGREGMPPGISSYDVEPTRAP